MSQLINEIISVFFEYEDAICAVEHKWVKREISDEEFIVEMKNLRDHAERLAERRVYGPNPPDDPMAKPGTWDADSYPSEREVHPMIQEILDKHFNKKSG